MNLINVVATMGLLAADTAEDQKGAMLKTLLMFGVMGAMFYFLLIRPQSKQRKALENLLKNLKTGDEILTSGGIIGIVTNVKDKEVVLKIADNVKIRIARSAVTAVVKKSDEPETTTETK